VDTNPDFDGVDVDRDNIVSGSGELLTYLLQIAVRRHGANWLDELTTRGKLWPDAAEEAEPAPSHRRARIPAQYQVAPDDVAAAPAHKDGAPRADASVRAALRIARQAATPRKRPPTKIVEKRETFIEYRVMVTRVQVAERWVRATDEEDAAKKVQAEFERPYGYFGSWTTAASEIEVVEAEQTTVIMPNPPSKDGPLQLGSRTPRRRLGHLLAALRACEQGRHRVATELASTSRGRRLWASSRRTPIAGITPARDAARQ
jgi:hypothetical protein